MTWCILMLRDDLEDEPCEKQATVTNTTLLMDEYTGPGLARLPSDTDGGHRYRLFDVRVRASRGVTSTRPRSRATTLSSG
jgi:hypothetical protein